MNLTMMILVASAVALAVWGAIQFLVFPAITAWEAQRTESKGQPSPQH